MTMQDESIKKEFALLWSPPPETQLSGLMIRGATDFLKLSNMNRGHSRPTALVIEDDFTRLEDDLTFLEIVTNGLEKMGFDTFMTYDWLIGLELFPATDAVLVVTNIRMLEMNDFQLLRVIKKFNSDTLVVLTCGLDVGRNFQKHFADHILQADGFIEKPFVLNDLRDAVYAAAIKCNNQIVLNSINFYDPTESDQNNKGASYLSRSDE